MTAIKEISALKAAFENNAALEGAWIDFEGDFHFVKRTKCDYVTREEILGKEKTPVETPQAPEPPTLEEPTTEATETAKPKAKSTKK